MDTPNAAGALAVAGYTPGRLVMVAVASVVIGRAVWELIRNNTGGIGGKVVRPVHPRVPDAPGSQPDTPVIQQVRDRLGRRPRSFDPPVAEYLNAKPPRWLRWGSRDPMGEVYRAQGRLRRDGKVVWAAVIQANRLLFDPGAHDHPASVVWSDDPYFDAHPDRLRQIASSLYDLKGRANVDPVARRFGQILADEMERANRLPVPPAWSDGRAVYHSSMMFVRKHLPAGHLSGSLFPVWADPQPTGLVLLVPAAYWPGPLLAAWAQPSPAD